MQEDDDDDDDDDDDVEEVKPPVDCSVTINKVRICTPWCSELEYNDFFRISLILMMMMRRMRTLSLMSESSSCTTKACIMPCYGT